MKQWLFLAVALVAIAFVLMKSRERFQPEFLDKSQVAKTVAYENSSHTQVTNHATPARYSMAPISGVETPFQVNQYKAYVV